MCVVVCGCEDGLLTCLLACLAGCRGERLHRPSAVLFPRLLGAGLQPRWVRPWSLLLAEGSARQEWTSTLRRVLPPSQACTPYFIAWSGLVPSIPCRCGTRENPPVLDANIQSPRTYQPIILPPISNSIATLSSPGPGASRLTNEMENRCLMPGCPLDGAAASFMLACLLACLPAWLTARHTIYVQQYIPHHHPESHPPAETTVRRLSKYGRHALLSEHGITAKLAVNPALATEESVETVAAFRQHRDALVRPDLSDAREKRRTRPHSVGLEALGHAPGGILLPTCELL